MAGTMYPAETWPPQSQVAGLFACRATGGSTIGYTLCTQINASPQRSRNCSGCACPWRICIACTIQHVTADDIRDIDPKSGLCAWHVQHGSSAIRPSTELSPARIRIAVRSIHAEVPGPEEEQNVGGENELIKKYARTAQVAFTPLMRRILELLHQGEDVRGICHSLNITDPRVRTVISQMGKTLGISIEGKGRMKTAHISSVLAQVQTQLLRDE